MRKTKAAIEFQRGYTRGEELGYAKGKEDGKKEARREMSRERYEALTRLINSVGQTLDALLRSTAQIIGEGGGVAP